VPDINPDGDPDWWDIFSEGAWPGGDGSGGWFAGGVIDGVEFPAGFYYPDGSYFPPNFPVDNDTGGGTSDFLSGPPFSFGGYFDGGEINGEYWPPGFYYPDGTYFPPNFSTDGSGGGFENGSGAQYFPGGTIDGKDFPAGFFYPDGSFFPYDGDDDDFSDSGFDRFITDTLFPPEDRTVIPRSTQQKVGRLINWRIRA
jgi:hypothetical protein